MDSDINARLQTAGEPRIYGCFLGVNGARAVSALAWLSALGLRDERKKAGALAMVWSTLISISTLTTKQHYFVDMVGGGGLAMLCR